MKISQEEYKKKAPKPIPKVKKEPPKEKQEDLVKALLAGIRERDEKESKKEDERLQQLKDTVKELGSDILKVRDTLESKPTSFVFDIQRNKEGYINTVLVKPENTKK